MATKFYQPRSVGYRFFLQIQSKIIYFKVFFYLLKIIHCSDLINLINKIKAHENNTKINVRL